MDTAEELAVLVAERERLDTSVSAVEWLALVRRLDRLAEELQRQVDEDE